MFSMEGMAMLVRYLLTGALALSLTVPAAAEPAKPQGDAEATRPADRPAEVVLASAEQVSVPVPALEAPASAGQAPATAPAKKRAARVTTCRCAGQSAER